MSSLELPLRVLQLIDTPGPGGAETVFVQLTERLQARGDHVLPVVATDRSWAADALSDRGIGAIVLPTTGRKLDWRWLWRLVRIVRRERIQIIHAHLYAPAVYGAIAATLTRVAALATIHGEVDLEKQGRTRGFKLLALRVGLNTVVCVSESLREAVARRLSFEPARTAVVWNGVDVEALQAGVRGALRSELSVGEHALLIGSIGNVRPAKDYPTFVRACRLMLAHHPDTYFVIAGDCDNELGRAVRQLSHELGMSDRIVFLGFRADVANVLADLDVLVVSSTSEGFSIAAVQALAAGVPVVATRSGGPEEIIDPGVNGLLVPHSNPRAIAEAVSSLLADPQMRRMMAAAGPETVRTRFSTDAMVQGYVTLYRAMLA